VRVIAGSLGGRVFDTPGTHRTHPMSDKARGALFNTLGDIEGLSVLDVFAGSGALGYEALSRGAGRVVAIESDITAQKTIARNMRALGLGKAMHLITTTANAWNTTAGPAMFDIVLCDPPYDDLQTNLITRVADARVTVGGLLVLSWPGSAEAPMFPGFETAVQRRYGDMQLIFHRRLPL
jgi:16S rRNA (guanine966-N2)-methyltransferase